MEYWCGRCGRWGSHKTDGHDEWRKNFKKNRRGNGNGPAANAASSQSGSSAAASTTRGSVTFLSALTGNTCVAIDPELADGIDL
jgi:hypothetical protein